MENMVDRRLEIYKNKKVFITGHTGFKGSWLTLTLQKLGCEVHGYSLLPDSAPNHYDLIKPKIDSQIGDIRDFNTLKNSLEKSKAEIVFHLAAQSLVRTSYIDPVYTYEVNVLGSLHVLQAATTCPQVKAIVMVTTDKVYHNIEQDYSYKENDRLGGYDIYSSSKACCELMIDSYRNSFCNINTYNQSHHILIASVRAGNVIGGGDWSKDRLIPDLIRAIVKKQAVQIRNPDSIRPWQHVLDCLYAYLLIGSKLLEGDIKVARAWNVAPEEHEIFSVRALLMQCKSHWNDVEFELAESLNQPHEAGLLMLDASKLISELEWKPKIGTTEAVELTIKWYKKYYLENEVSSFDQVDYYFEL